MTIGVLFRRTILLATSVLCGAGCVTMLDAADPPDVGDDPRALPERAHFQVGTCGMDEMRERVCGFLAEPVDAAADPPFLDCPADPRQLTSAGATMLFYPDTKRLEFDRLMTLQYREELGKSCGGDPDQERPGQCCFSRCTPLPTAAESTREVPDGYRETSRCVDAPEGGTYHPAAGYAECPNAVVLGFGPSPFDADPFDAEATAKIRKTRAELFGDTERCCYRALEPIR